jgi:RNA polymerase sigma factor for flagellar operon FliA
LADTAQLWARCRGGDAGARCTLIERYVPLAVRVARNMNVPVGPVAGLDDLESAALIGLIDAVDRFQPERGVPFEGYATLRIRGAVLDEVRRVDELGRADRRRQREAAAQGEEGAYLGTVSLDELIENGYRGGVEQGDELAERYEAEDLHTRVRSAMDCLPARQREVLERYYDDSLTLRETGMRMGISEARACQLHGRAIQNLRRQFASYIRGGASSSRVPVAA